MDACKMVHDQKMLIILGKKYWKLLISVISVCGGLLRSVCVLFGVCGELLVAGAKWKKPDPRISPTLDSGVSDLDRHDLKTYFRNP